MAEDITIHVKDTHGIPVDGVLVRLYTDAHVFLEAETTGAGSMGSGNAIFASKPAPADYYVVMSYASPGYSFTLGSKQDISVLDAPAPPLSNIFDVEINTFDLPSVTGTYASYLCRCSGYFIDPSGVPYEGMTFRFNHRGYPIFLRTTPAATGVLPLLTTATTDSSGFAQIDLVRESIYYVTIDGLADQDSYKVIIPNASAASLPDVLFPTITSVVFLDNGTPITTKTVPVGTSPADLDVQIRMKSGFIFKLTEMDKYEIGTVPIELVSSDETIASVRATEEGMSLTASTTTGTTTITAIRYPQPTVGTSVESYPLSSEPTGSLVVTVV